MTGRGGAPHRTPKFELGGLVATPGVLDAVGYTDILVALRRHALGDWGEVDIDDGRANDQALVEGARLLSVYRSTAGIKFWIITEADRSATTVLLPEEY